MSTSRMILASLPSFCQKLSKLVEFDKVLIKQFCTVFTARRYASAVLAVIVCLSVRPSVRLSVCLSVCLSQVEVVQRWLNLGSD